MFIAMIDSFFSSVSFWKVSINFFLQICFLFLFGLHLKKQQQGLKVAFLVRNGHPHLPPFPLMTVATNGLWEKGNYGASSSAAPIEGAG